MVPFEEKGREVVAPLEEDDRDIVHFTPHHTSSPSDGYAQFELSTDAVLSPIGAPIYSNNSPLKTRVMAGRNPMRRMKDTADEPTGERGNKGMESLLGVPERWIDEDLWLKKYIDDGIAGEKLPIMCAVSHTTSDKERRMIHVKKSETFFRTTLQNANKKGMKINSLKT